MGKREKIIVAIMIVALLYGAFELLVPSGDKTVSKIPEADIEAARQTARKISGEMEDAELSPEQTSILKLAGRQWKNDPFYRLPEQQKENDAEKPSGNGHAEKLQYTGYLEIGETKMAIINGAEYFSGDRLEQGDALVHNITSEKVVLKSLNTGEKMSVPYREKKQEND